ncbi:MAG: hypothetical protein AB7S26_01280 [Sandaracinaceae bacterium]
MRSVVRWIPVVLLSLPPSIVSAQVVENTPLVENTPSLCQNGADDDGDGAIDCDDDGCRRLIFCVNHRPEEVTEAACTNGEDDDGDGAVDCADDGCVDHCTSIVVGPRQRETDGIYAPREEEARPEVGFLEHEDPRDYPFGYAERPLTYLTGMLVPEASVAVRNPPGVDGIVDVTFGLGFGVLDFLELQLAAVPIHRAPGVVAYGSPSLGTTLRIFDEEVVEVGLYANLVVPLTTSPGVVVEPGPERRLFGAARLTDVTQLDGALLLRFHIEDLARLDLTLPIVTVRFSENLAGDLDPIADLLFDARVGFSITDYAYVGLVTGILLQGPQYGDPIVPLSFFAGAVIPGPSRRGPLLDVGVRFGWPTFAHTSPPSGDAVDASRWQLTFDVRVFSFLLP